jgi:hypothetical protein
MNRAEIVLSAVPQALRNWFLEEKGIAFCISVNTEIPDSNGFCGQRFLI